MRVPTPIITNKTSCTIIYICHKTLVYIRLPTFCIKFYKLRKCLFSFMYLRYVENDAKFWNKYLTVPYTETYFAIIIQSQGGDLIIANILWKQDGIGELRMLNIWIKTIRPCLWNFTQPPNFIESVWKWLTISSITLMHTPHKMLKMLILSFGNT